MENQIEIIITQRVLIELLSLKADINENTYLTKAEIRCLIDAQISKNEVQLEKLKVIDQGCQGREFLNQGFIYPDPLFKITK